MKISMTRENYGAQFGAFTLLDDSVRSFAARTLSFSMSLQKNQPYDSR
jgi:hypothetical protein